MKHSPCEIVSSSRASERIAAAAAFLEALLPGTEALAIAATREAADDLVRKVSVTRSATFGIHRLTLTRLAGLLASDHLYSHRLAPAAGLAIEAIAARVVHRLKGTGALEYFEPVIDMPGFPRALARTISELRQSRIAPDALNGKGGAAAALANALTEFEAELATAKLADRASILIAATDALKASEAPRFSGLPCVMLDVAIDTVLEAELVTALCARAPSFLATIPAGDERSRAFLRDALGADVVVLRGEDTAPNSLRRLQEQLFADAPEHADLDSSVTVVSAPGEMHEAVEIARRIHDEARRGVPFDKIAVLCHVGERYGPYLQEALHRAGIPAYFATSTRRPEPGGRALLQLLSCARENLSAKCFGEYLSLAQVPDPDAQTASPFAPPEAEVFSAPLASDLEVPPAVPEAEPPEVSPVPVVEGTLKAPWRWEKLLVESAVIGGRERWRRRLVGIENELRRNRDELPPEETGWIERQLVDLDHLKTIALPIIDKLDARPTSATWREWLVYLRELTLMAIRDSEPVLRALAELEPMAPVGPLGLDEVLTVLSERLGHLEARPPHRRYGHVFIAPPQYARGMEFDVVIVPGLAERMFPKKLTEDPILSDAIRERVAPELKTQATRRAAERLALHLAAGAATRAAMFSYPRVDLDQGRPRVPSFYTLELMRAAEGRLPGFAELARRAACEQATRLGWPAPENENLAIDTAEFDLAILDKLVAREPDETVGAAHYLLNEESNPHLPRALRARARRWRPRWTSADGLVDPGPGAMAALQRHQVSSTTNGRAYSPTALENFSKCPYKFLLQAIFRLEPREEPEALEAIDPLTRGSLTHEIQFEILSRLRDLKMLPITPANLEAAQAELEHLVDEVAERWRDELAPAIERVWRDGIDAIRADLREWMRRASQDPQRFCPERFELAFGLRGRDHADPSSSKDAIEIAGGLKLRGSIDLVERSGDGVLRVTDHKTGKVRAQKNFIIAGGKILQPVLYALAAERVLHEPVRSGRLYYCTATGNYEERIVEIDEAARASVQDFIATLSDSLKTGFLPAAPEPRECDWCNFRRVCGPYEAQRMRIKAGGLAPNGALSTRKEAQRVAPLWNLRGKP
ncbi:MAG TPA: PD-(D/E)XK nuclease family protein [Candidatus Binataceae bacterium]|nr:PD-(D/E)XK nuclease family protein [Candidatus Binataceae bacterium]